jgi:hypothetical protein
VAHHCARTHPDGAAQHHHLAEHILEIEIAALAMVEEDAGGCALDGGIDIGIVQDDVGRLAAQFQAHPAQIVRGGLDDQLADFGRAGEGDLVDIRMRGQCRARGFAKAGHDIDYAVGKPGFQQQLAQLQAGQRRFFRYLEHHGAAGGERGAQLPGRHQQREIPGNDLAHHADRFGPDEGVIFTRRYQVRKGDGLAFDLGGPAGHVVEQVGGQRHVRDAGHGEWLAIVQAFQLRQLVQMLQDQVADLVDHAAARRRAHLAPRSRQRAPCRLDGRIDIGGIAFGHRGQLLFGGRILHVESLAGLGHHPFAVDQHGPGLGQPFPQGRRHMFERIDADIHIFLPACFPRFPSAWSTIGRPRGLSGIARATCRNATGKEGALLQGFSGRIPVESGLCAFWLQDFSTKPTVSRHRPPHMKILCGAAPFAP